MGVLDNELGQLLTKILVIGFNSGRFLRFSRQVILLLLQIIGQPRDLLLRLLLSSSMSLFLDLETIQPLDLNLLHVPSGLRRPIESYLLPHTEGIQFIIECRVTASGVG